LGDCRNSTLVGLPPYPAGRFTTLSDPSQVVRLGKRPLT
jgi:hypothetical protein